MKVRSAEWILSQVLPPDRAASTIGDWLEDAPKRGNIWFWSCVLRTTTSAIRNDLTDRPFGMLGLTLRGCLVCALLTWLAVSLWFTAMSPFFIAFAICKGLKIAIPGAVNAIWLVSGTLTGLFAQAWCQYQTGRWIARRAPGREMAACLVFCLLLPMVFRLAGVVMTAALYVTRPHIPLTMPIVIASNTVYIFAAFAGAQYVRRHSIVG
jgi:hypothetical protein